MTKPNQRRDPPPYTEVGDLIADLVQFERMFLRYGHDPGDWPEALPLRDSIVLDRLAKFGSLYSCCVNCCSNEGCFGWVGPHSKWQCKALCWHPAIVAACCWIEKKETGCQG